MTRLGVSNTAKFFLNSETGETFPLKSGQGKAAHNHQLHSSLFWETELAGEDGKKEKGGLHSSKKEPENPNLRKMLFEKTENTCL